MAVEVCTGSVEVESMNQPLFDVLRAAVDGRPGFWFVMDPASEECFFNGAIRQRVGLRCGLRRLWETRAMMLNFEECVPEAFEQLKCLGRYCVVAMMRLSEVESEPWAVHGRLITCVEAGHRCPNCSATQRCRVVVGASVPLSARPAGSGLGQHQASGSEPPRRS